MGVFSLDVAGPRRSSLAQERTREPASRSCSARRPHAPFSSRCDEARRESTRSTLFDREASSSHDRADGRRRAGGGEGASIPRAEARPSRTARRTTGRRRVVIITIVVAPVASSTGARPRPLAVVPRRLTLFLALRRVGKEEGSRGRKDDRGHEAEEISAAPPARLATGARNASSAVESAEIELRADLGEASDVVTLLRKLSVGGLAKRRRLRRAPSARGSPSGARRPKVRRTRRGDAVPARSTARTMASGMKEPARSRWRGLARPGRKAIDGAQHARGLPRRRRPRARRTPPTGRRSGVPDAGASSEHTKASGSSQRASVIGRARRRHPAANTAFEQTDENPPRQALARTRAPARGPSPCPCRRPSSGREILAVVLGLAARRRRRIARAPLGGGGGRLSTAGALRRPRASACDQERQGRRGTIYA